jgi:hypothetical protein
MRMHHLEPVSDWEASLLILAAATIRFHPPPGSTTMTLARHRVLTALGLPTWTPITSPVTPAAATTRFDGMLPSAASWLTGGLLDRLARMPPAALAPLVTPRASGDGGGGGSATNRIIGGSNAPSGRCVGHVNALNSYVYIIKHVGVAPCACMYGMRNRVLGSEPAAAAAAQSAFPNLRYRVTGGTDALPGRQGVV